MPTRLSITEEAANARPIVICGDDPREDVSEFDSSGGALIQEVLLLRGRSPKFRNRGNQSQTIPFVVVREHATIGKAVIFAIEHLGTLVKTGLIEISAEYENERIVRFTRGAIKQCGTRFKGRSTWTRYELRVGEILTERPS